MREYPYIIYAAFAALLFSATAWSSDREEPKGWGDAELALERRPCHWLILNARELLANPELEELVDIEEMLSCLNGLEEKMALAIDLTAKDLRGDIRLKGQSTKVIWNDIPGYNSEEEWEKARERYQMLPEEFRDRLARAESDPQGYAFPLLQTQLLIRRLAELGWDSETSSPIRIQDAIFRGASTEAFYLIGPQPESFQVMSAKFLQRDRKRVSPVVLMASPTGKVRNRELKELAHAIRFDLSGQEGPLAEDGHLHFNTPFIQTWGNTMGAGEWETAVQVAVLSAFEHGQQEVKLRVPLWLVGNGAHISARTRGTCVIGPKQGSVYDLYPATVAQKVASEFGLAHESGRAAAGTALIQRELRKLALSLIPSVNESTDYKGEITIHPMDDLNDVPLSMNYEFRVSRPGKRRIVVQTISNNDVTRWLELMVRFLGVGSEEGDQ